MNSWAKAALFFNLPISFSAGLLSFGWTQHMGLPNSSLFGIFSGSACLFLYNCHRYFKRKETGQGQRFFNLLLILCSGSLAIGLITLQALSVDIIKALIFLFPAVLLAAFYLLPDGKRGLRTVPFLKAPLVSITWVYLMFVFPLTYVDSHDIQQMYAFMGFLFFFFALTLPFDTRDVKVDSPKLLTIPMVFGLRNTCLLGCLLLTGFWFTLFTFDSSPEWRWGFTCFTMVAILGMLWPLRFRNNLYYIGLDLLPGILGMLLLLT